MIGRMTRMTYPTEIKAFMWYCGDEFCECSQPVIEKFTWRSDELGRRKLIKRERLWEGTFHSEAELEEREEQHRELAAECARRSIPLPNSITA